ncbi:MAG: acyl-ACP--UDP-N-acetylglucosamine O-acyltransferase [Candidatus Omnitrophica bacterium]|nr:acyl-ACP--UDP-N-acetylglucosamine O-acyltransferase [Candidatus Omnitrophota bacterium]
MENISIHETAIVDPKAKLSPGVKVGPYAIIGPDVVIGDHTVIGNHAVVTGQTKIGMNCKIYTGAVVGSPPQDKKHSADDNVFLNIGDNNVIREYVTINPGTVDGGSQTVLGNNNWIMAYCHVAHDCVIGNSCTMANNASLAGHVVIEDNVTIGGFGAIHQFTRLGRLSMIGGCSKVSQDVPPFCLCDGNPAKVIGLNNVGLKRSGLSPKTLLLLKHAVKILFRSGLSKKTALENIEKGSEMVPELQHLIFFAKTSKRGMISGSNLTED